MTIGLYLVTIIARLLSRELPRTVIIEALRHILIIAIGLVLYYVATKCILHFASVSFSSYRGANSSIRDILASSGQGLLNAIGDFFNFFFTNKIYQSNSYWHRQFLNTLVFLVCLIELIRIAYQNKTLKRLPGIIIVICLLPIGACIIDAIVPKNHVNLLMGVGLITPYLLFVFLNDQLSLKNFIFYL